MSRNSTGTTSVGAGENGLKRRTSKKSVISKKTSIISERPSKENGNLIKRILIYLVIIIYKYKIVRFQVWK